MSLKLITKHVVSCEKKEIIEKYKTKVLDIFQSIQNKSAIGSEMTGWIDWIFQDHQKLFKQINDIKEFWIAQGVEVVVVVGTGGSYVGCKAILNFVNDESKKNNFEFVFVPSFSERFLGTLLKKLKTQKFAIVVISKSGTTLESSISFRFLRDLLLDQQQEKYYKYVIAITDKKKGILRELADKSNFHTFDIQDDIGGRYSTLTAVGLVPMLLSGIDGNEVMAGALQAHSDHFHSEIEKNDAALYAAYRHFLFTEKKLCMECFISYDPQLDFTLEKMKQLFAESEGKQEKGLMPVLLNFTPDLHSVGQLLQDGPKKFFETTILVHEDKHNLIIKPSNFNDDDKLDWLANKTLKSINNCAMEGTINAHTEVGNINNLIIELSDWSAYSFGYFYFWLSMSAMFSAYLFEVNPFDQPGVEAYKRRMFDLLKK